MSCKKIISILSLSVFISAQINSNAQIVKKFTYQGSQQTWTVPSCVTQLTITAIGAAGGGESQQFPLMYGGHGATMVGLVAVTAGDVINIYTGDTGATNNNFDGGAGGGGTFVWDATASKLLEVAGGGGGSFSYSYNGYDASVTTTPTGQNGGSGELGGGAAAIDAGGGGAGFLGNGATSGNQEGGLGGSDKANGFTGGAGDIAGGDQLVVGGYGGGGGSGYNDGGGGGGYSGGGSGAEDGGGGGSSYVNGTVLSSATTNTGVGSVTISYAADTVGKVTAHIINNVNCFGGNGGMASAIVTGGSPTYIYAWTPVGGTRDTASGLSAGTYTITVHDPCGNSVSATAIITQPSAVAVSASPLANISCNGGNNGTASSTVNGGTGPYTYSWTPSGGNSAVGSGLSAGVYTLNVTDNHGCTGSARVTITQPNTLAVSAKTTANIDCNGNSDGAASAIVSSGTSPYTYAWSPAGGSTANISNMPAGTYSINVTDNNGCTGSAVITITQPAAALATSLSVLNNVLCNGQSTGSIDASTSGGTSPYTYAWTGGGTKDTAIALSAGTYTLNLLDAHGCKVSASGVISQPSAVSIIKNTTPDDGSCTGSAWVVVNGGVAPYVYLWSNGIKGAYNYGICHNTYCCSVTDAHGCADSVCIIVESDAGINNIASGAGKISVYPNPNNGQFTIVSSASSGISMVEIYNVLGEKVYTTSLNSNKGGTSSININNQPNGIYLYRVISNDNGSLVGEGKIVLEK